LADPRRGLTIAVAVIVACVGWFVGAVLFEAPLAERLGMNRHAITFAAIVGGTFAVAAGLVFARFSAVREELLEGRRVLGRWQVDRETWAAVCDRTCSEDARDKRAALGFMLLAIVVCFGVFALIDKEAAAFMIGIGVGSASLIATAFLIGERVRTRQWQFRTGEVIVGERGLMADGVLHVWALPFNRLTEARFQPRPPALIVAYGWLGRAGWQEATVVLPVPADLTELARAVGCALAFRSSRARRKAGRRK